MKTLTAGLALGMAVALAGCASPNRQADGELIAAAPASGPAANNMAGQDGHQMTGSRIPKRTSTDRTLRTVGARGARDAIDESYRPLSAGRSD